MFPPACFIICPSEPKHRWLTILANKYAAHGAKKFQDAAATLAPDANKQLNTFDQTVLWIAGELLAQRPDDKAVAQRAQAIIDRYLAAEQFAAADDGVKAAQRLRPTAGQSRRLGLAAVEAPPRTPGGAKAAGRQSSVAQANSIRSSQNALAAAFQKLSDNPTKENRRAVSRLLDALVHRYASLERQDLAEAVIGLASDAKLPQLDDWIVWTKANLLAGEAARSFAAAVGQATAPGKLTIVAEHQAELDLLIQFVGKYPDSDYFSPAVARVSQLADLYQQQRAFDAATGILATFLKAQPNLKVAPQLEYQALEIQLAKANAAFEDRKDKLKPPEKLSAEFQTAIDAIAAYLKAHPTGDQSPAVLNELLDIARTYGKTGAWPVAREVLARFAAAAAGLSFARSIKTLASRDLLGRIGCEQWPVAAHAAAAAANEQWRRRRRRAWRLDGERAADRNLMKVHLPIRRRRRAACKSTLRKPRRLRCKRSPVRRERRPVPAHLRRWAECRLRHADAERGEYHLFRRRCRYQRNSVARQQFSDGRRHDRLVTP